MDTKTMTAQARLRHWVSVMQERSASGLSVRAWCQENEVREKTYYYWQPKLRKAACEHLVGDQGPEGLVKNTGRLFKQRGKLYVEQSDCDCREST